MKFNHLEEEAKVTCVHICAEQADKVQVQYNIELTNGTFELAQIVKALKLALIEVDDNKHMLVEKMLEGIKNPYEN